MPESIEQVESSLASQLKLIAELVGKESMEVVSGLAEGAEARRPAIPVTAFSTTSYIWDGSHITVSGLLKTQRKMRKFQGQPTNAATSFTIKAL